MKSALLFFISCIVFFGCNRTPVARTFDQEFQLTLRAGRGELTDDEKSELLRENHPILAQVGEPQMAPLVTLFSQLEPQFHKELLTKSYVKWRLADFPPETQDMIGEVVFFTVQHRGMIPALLGDEKNRVVSLVDADVGFAVVELPQSKEKVISWFAFAKELPSPLWITIVNSPASSSDGYVQAHMERLPLLRTMRSSSPPLFRPDRVTYLVTSPGPELICSSSG